MSDSTDQHNKPTPVPAGEGVNLQDLVTGLDFTPAWARASSDEPVKAPDRRPRDEERRNARPRRDGERRGHRPPDARGERRDRPRDDSRGHASKRERPPRREERVFLPVEVNFIPDRDRLGAVVHHLHAIKRAFPLTYLAQLFLVKPEYHLIKLEARAVPGGTTLQFFQDRESKLVFLSLEELHEHLRKNYLERHIERVEQQIEPPAGNFICVGQCKRSGTLIGPPNYHGYNERMMEVHRTSFPHLSLDEYRNSIEMVRDPAVIERWKQDACRQVKYRPKDTPDAPASLSLMQAENLFMEQHAATYVHTASKVIMPASAMAVLRDERLRSVINAARAREDRFPFSIMLAVRPAFRRMRLHLFKVGKGETYATAIPPKPFDATHAIPSIKDMVSLIAEHPGWTRQTLVEKLYPGKAVDDPEVVEKMSPLAWLVDKGHVIEFFNGTYAIPGHLRVNESAPTEKPQEHHHPELTLETRTAPAAIALPPEALDEPALPVDSPEGGAPSQC